MRHKRGDIGRRDHVARGPVQQRRILYGLRRRAAGGWPCSHHPERASDTPLGHLQRPRRRTDNLQGLDIERATRDLADAQPVARVVTGVRYLIHAAADYRLWAPDPAAECYPNVVPEIVRDHIRGIIDNLAESRIFLTDLLQARPEAAGITLNRSS